MLFFFFIIYESRFDYICLLVYKQLKHNVIDYTSYSIVINTSNSIVSADNMEMVLVSFRHHMSQSQYGMTVRNCGAVLLNYEIVKKN